MEPRIQYAQTSDGVNIAYYKMGEGTPLVCMPSPPWSHVQLEWQMPAIRSAYERFAEKRQFVRFDSRGTGLSEQKGADFSLDTLVLDLEAVVDRLGLARFALWGLNDSGPAAISYAVRHPERVSHLLLWCTYACGSDYLQAPEIPALYALVDKDWHLFTETMARVGLGWSTAEEAGRFAELLREITTPEAVQKVWRANLKLDVTTLLPQVRSPTMVLHRRDIRWMTTDMAKGLASHIPDARLVLLEGTSVVPFGGDIEVVARVIDEFLGEGEETAVAAEPHTPGAFRTVLFTDVEGSTALTQRLGDAKAREVLREHERIVREALKAHGGSEVKTMGDGFMASFGSATKALECAVAMQQAFAERNASLPAHPERVEGRAERPPSAHPSRASGRADSGVGAAAGEAIRVRIGLNAGEPIAEDDPDGRGDLFGTAVIRAARIAAMAQGGEILAANVVRELAEGKGFLFGDRGEVALRGFDDPVRVFEVRWTPFDSPSAAATGGSG